MKTIITLKHEVTVIVEADNYDQAYNWALEHTPSGAVEEAAKAGNIAGEDWAEEVRELDPDDKASPDIDIREVK